MKRPWDRGHMQHTVVGIVPVTAPVVAPAKFWTVHVPGTNAKLPWTWLGGAPGTLSTRQFDPSVYMAGPNAVQLMLIP
jgi:hypothetical protein